MKEKTNEAKNASQTEEVKVAQPADAQPASLLQKELELRRTRSKSGLSALQVELAKRKGTRVKGHLTVAQEALRRRRR